MKEIPDDIPMEPFSTPPPIMGDSRLTTIEHIQSDRFVGSGPVDRTVSLSRNPPSLVYGSEVNGSWDAVAKNEPIKVGDYLRITYRFKMPFFEEWQTNQFITKLQEDNRYDVKYVSLSEEEGRIWVIVRVKTLDFGLTAILVCIGIAAIGIGIGFYLTTEGIEKLVQSAAKSLDELGGNVPLILGAAALVLFMFAKVKAS